MEQVSLKDVFLGWLLSEEESEEEQIKNFHGLMVDDNGEPYYDELAYITYWEGMEDKNI